LKISEIINKQFQLEGHKITYEEIQSNNFVVKSKGKSIIWWEFYTISLENSILWDAFVKANVAPHEINKILFSYALTTRWPKIEKPLD